MKKPKLLGRIRYVEDWMDRGEYFVFETRWEDEEDWGLDTAYPLKDDKLSWRALYKACEWKELGIDFFYGEPILKEG